MNTVVVITGSSRGIGYGLADAFLELGCAVTVSGRSPQSSALAADRLAATYAEERVLGFACDVTLPAQVVELWEATRDRFGKAVRS